MRDAIPTQLWQCGLLWVLDLPLAPVLIASMAWLFDLQIWHLDGVPYCLTPNTVRVHPARHREQYQRTLAADLTYRVHLSDLHGRWTVLDRLHRLLRAGMLGWADILARKVGADDYRRILDHADANTKPG